MMITESTNVTITFITNIVSKNTKFFAKKNNNHQNGKLGYYSGIHKKQLLVQDTLNYSCLLEKDKRKNYLQNIPKISKNYLHTLFF